MEALRFKRAAFYNGLKSKVGLAAAKAAALRVNRNDGNPLGWLARRRIEGGHGAEGNQTDIVGFGVRDTRPRLY